MRNNTLRGAIATCVLVTAANANADDATPSTSCEAKPPECPQPQAQAEPPLPPPIPPPPQPRWEEPTTPPWYDRAGWALTGGGGVDAFVKGGAANVTNTGGGWAVRLTMGTKWWFAGEAVYIGSAQSVNNFVGLESKSTLVGNGLQADVRFNLTRHYFVQPFVFTGVAWRHYDLTNANFNTSDVSDSANVVELPYGFGVAGYWRNLVADVRGDYRWAWGDRLTAFGDEDQDRWNVMGNIGIAFR